MILSNRDKLPFRRNSEGYFINNNGKILVKNSGKGYLIFPGGGINSNETPEQGMLREAHEETGVLIDGKLKKLGVLHIIWGENWAKTEKQKNRYKLFKGEEMYFFCGKIKTIEDNLIQEEDTWQGEKLMPILKAIHLIEESRPFSEEIHIYREAQLQFIHKIAEEYT